MTSQERFRRIYEHKEADRIPHDEYVWESTLARWHREGFDKNTDWKEYFDSDITFTIKPDTSLRLPTRVLEETEEYIIGTDTNGATHKNFKREDTTPEALDFSVKTADDWFKLKDRLTPDKSRIDWKLIDKQYKEARKKGGWIIAGGWFGFDITHARLVGTERTLMAMALEPDWIVDIFNTQLNTNIALFDMLINEGYEFDCLMWWDDMGYKHHQFFSLDMYRDLLKPIHKRAIEWAHSKGMKTHLHSCGDINPFIPELIELGLDGINPLEVKAGMSPIKIKKEYGDNLVLHGGINAEIWHETAQVEAMLRERIPVLKENGGYIFASDHSVPSSVSFKNFSHIMKVLKEVGKY